MPSSVVIVGASGLIGSVLTDYLSQNGYKVIPIKHQDIEHIPQTDIVINLAGCDIAGALWTKSYKQKIFNSRIETTKTLVKHISPQLFISASATGYYGNKDDQIVTEESPVGTGFLANVVNEWEKASASLSCRKVYARIAPVLTKTGGFLGKQLPAFRLGLGLVMGPGTAWQSWIHQIDLARAFLHVIETPSLEGPVNFSAPTPLTQLEFADTLASVLHRPRLLRIPSFLLRHLPGNMGQELFLNSCRAYPKALLDSGFSFTYPELRPALENLCF